jgi:teichuronic acid exporter
VAQTTEQASNSGTSLGTVAVHGGLWTGAQVVLNKLVSLGGTFVLMYLLVPEEFGIASVALSIQSLLMLLPAFTLSDVLLARPAECRGVLRRANRLCAKVAVGMSVLLVLGGHAAARHFSQPGLATAAWIIALRPLADLWLFGPQTLWRVSLGFRHMARVDALCQTVSTFVSVLMAWFGAGFASILLPPILFTAVRAVWLGWRAPTEPIESPDPPHVDLWRPYVLSGLGQYVHGALIMIPPVLLAQFATEREAGWFSTSFALSASINSVVATSMGLVLQPIFAQMDGDRERQSAAFVRACATIAAVSMPLCFMQSALMGPAFRLMLPSKWEGAIVMGSVMSVGQAFYFAVNPAMGLLKAQGRFMTFLGWQFVQLIAVTAAMIAAGALWDRNPALAIVSVYGLYHLVFSPVGVRLCLARRSRFRKALDEIFIRPLLASVVVIAPAAWVLGLAPHSVAWDLVRLLAIPAWVVGTYPKALACIAPTAFVECRRLALVVVDRVRGRPAGGDRI